MLLSTTVPITSMKEQTITSIDRTFFLQIRTMTGYINYLHLTLQTHTLKNGILPTTTGIKTILL